MSPCMFCDTDALDSRLLRCGHPVHGRCLMQYLRFVPHICCFMCRAPLRAPDIGYVLLHYRDCFTQERYAELRSEELRVLFRDLNELDLDGSHLNH